MALVAAVAGAVRGIGGAVSANQRKQKNKGIIGKAYQEGRKRLDLMQGDTRQSFGEGLVARGLHLGGNVRASGPIAPEKEGYDRTFDPSKLTNPSPFPQGGGAAGFRHRIRQAYTMTPRTNPTVDLTQASDLGSQQQADLNREQQLEQNELRTGYETAIANNDAQGFNEQVNSLAAGVDTGMGLNDALGNLSSVQSAYAAPKVPSPYPDAWGGIDPVDPLGRGAWSNPWTNLNPGRNALRSTADFNIFNENRG